MAISCTAVPLELCLGRDSLVLGWCGHLDVAPNGEHDDGSVDGQSSTPLHLDGVLGDGTWRTADGGQSVAALGRLEAVGGPDGLPGVVLGDLGLEREEAVACMAIAILHLGAVEGGEDGREEAGLEAEVWLADAIEESSGVVALASRVSTELRGLGAAAAALEEGVEEGAHEEEEHHAPSIVQSFNRQHRQDKTEGLTCESVLLSATVTRTASNLFFQEKNVSQCMPFAPSVSWAALSADSAERKLTA